MAKFSEVKNKKCEVNISSNVTIQENVILGDKCKKVSIGFGSFIGRDVFIDVEDLTIGDYTTIHHGSILSGINTAIGHNCWIGHYTIIDSLGGMTKIGNNVGVGAHSQLWSHMKFGDVLAGCQWSSSGKLILEDDVWLVGHSITGPITAGSKSMLMTGGVALKDMEKNCIYAGSPAVNVTQKLGHQFAAKIPSKIIDEFLELLEEFKAISGEKICSLVVVDEFDFDNVNVTQFKPVERLYLPMRSDVEYKFIKYCLYDKAKFLPVVV
ncbi:hypothetical protein [Cycloclasticus pugetii]|uniref:hypothetical protein n=1 Tax=Cycloclasticus pugetii TaxID=34068 RepID=UPI003A8DD7F2